MTYMSIFEKIVAKLMTFKVVFNCVW